MLGIGLMLVCLRVLVPDAGWKEGLIKFAFWAMIGGLFAMCIGSLLRRLSGNKPRIERI